MRHARAAHLRFALSRRLNGAPGLLDRVLGPAPPVPAPVTPELSMVFVCHGNICRSPMAQEVMRRKLAERGWLGRVAVASAGTECSRAGARPDLRARACVRRRGGNIADLRARRFSPEDFDRFDLVFVMDARTERDVLARARGDQDRTRVRKLTIYAGGSDIPDPVHDGRRAFETAFEAIEHACDGILSRLAVDEACGRLTLRPVT